MEHKLTYEDLIKKVAELEAKIDQIDKDAAQSCSGGMETENDVENLRVSNEMFQLVMDNIPQFIFWKDLDSVYLGCNRNFALAAGVDTPEAIRGKTDYDLAWKKEEADFFVKYDKKATELFHKEADGQYGNFVADKIVNLLKNTTTADSAIQGEQDNLVKAANYGLGN